MIMAKLNFIFTSDRPIYLQLVEQLTLYIVSGKLPPGEKLPPIRELALLAKVNPNTLQRALAELEDQKLIHTERTNGKYITSDIKLIERHRTKFADEKVKNYLREMRDLGLTPAEAVQYLIHRGGLIHD